MRIYLKTTSNTEPVPFDYQQKLIGCIHKWLGDNELHDKISLYSFSWLRNGKKNGNDLAFRGGAEWFISFYEDKYVKKIIQTILSDPQMFCGMQVIDITICETPDFSNQEYFRLASPVFIKRRLNEKDIRFYLFDDPEANGFMVETLKHKMEIAGLPVDDTLDIQFDLNYPMKKVKKVKIHGDIKCSMCPLIIKGKPETKAFAWAVGIGNGTGSSMGALI